MCTILFRLFQGTGKTSTILALARDIYGYLLAWFILVSLIGEKKKSPEAMKSRVLELNASDERGIDIVREKVKNFARVSVSSSGSSPSGNVLPPFKIIILDEADSMTVDAQSALRRTMETYSKMTRFCLICNYYFIYIFWSSFPLTKYTRIIEPLTSRCSKFRFKPLDNESIRGRLTEIADKEGVQCPTETIDMIIKVSEGDLRKAIMYLQSAYRLHQSEPIEARVIVEIAGVVPDAVIDGLFTAWVGRRFYEAQKCVKDVVRNGYSGGQIVLQLFDRVLGDVELTSTQKARMSESFGQIDKALIDGSDEEMQLLKLLSDNRKHPPPLPVRIKAKSGTHNPDEVTTVMSLQVVQPRNPNLPRMAIDENVNDTNNDTKHSHKQKTDRINDNHNSHAHKLKYTGPPAITTSTSTITPLNPTFPSPQSQLSYANNSNNNTISFHNHLANLGLVRTKTQTNSNLHSHSHPTTQLPPPSPTSLTPLHIHTGHFANVRPRGPRSHSKGFFSISQHVHQNENENEIHEHHKPPLWALPLGPWLADNTGGFIRGARCAIMSVPQTPSIRSNSQTMSRFVCEHVVGSSAEVTCADPPINIQWASFNPATAIANVVELRVVGDENDMDEGRMSKKKKKKVGFVGRDFVEALFDASDVFSAARGDDEDTFALSFFPDEDIVVVPVIQKQLSGRRREFVYVHTIVPKQVSAYYDPIKEAAAISRRGVDGSITRVQGIDGEFLHLGLLPSLSFSVGNSNEHIDSVIGSRSGSIRSVDSTSSMKSTTSTTTKSVRSSITMASTGGGGSGNSIATTAASSSKNRIARVQSLVIEDSQWQHPVNEYHHQAKNSYNSPLPTVTTTNMPLATNKLQNLLIRRHTITPSRSAAISSLYSSGESPPPKMARSSTNDTAPVGSLSRSTSLLSRSSSFVSRVQADLQTITRIGSRGSAKSSGSGSASLSGGGSMNSNGWTVGENVVGSIDREAREFRRVSALYREVRSSYGRIDFDLRNHENEDDGDDLFGLDLELDLGEIDLEDSVGKKQGENNVADGFWSIHTEYEFPGTSSSIGNRTLIVRLSAGFAVINPTQATDSTVSAVKSLEERETRLVKYILTTGDWHYLRMGDWLTHFPTAKCYIPPGRIESKIAELEHPFSYEILDPEVDNPLKVQLGSGLVMQTVFGMKQFATLPDFGNTRRIEYAYFHPGSQSVITGDSFWYFYKDFGAARIVGEKSGIKFHFAKFANVASIEGLKYSLGKILEWDFQNFVPVHGMIDGFLRTDAKSSFASSLDFLDTPPEGFKNSYKRSIRR
ncbi:hypothetical protein HK100_003253 [Physocladia obscura]|uniref:Uncharacterized protein n=1 Tax=Physocladia obscura TaxID=109957 RepID=A0AAD5TA09_9FUNG|nr:hypothetical protein HK100_003253 [Physocladia obscura]